MTNEEKQRKVVEGLSSHLAEYLEKNGPVALRFRPYGFRFEVYGTSNEGMMQLTGEADGGIQLRLGVRRKGTDRLTSNCYPAASAEDMIRCLRDPASHRAWLERIAYLSGRVDDYWG